VQCSVDIATLYVVGIAECSVLYPLLHLYSVRIAVCVATFHSVRIDVCSAL
jgi:hypothetical protein